ncbi:UDP-N-acetylglucosamine 2-epimerase [Catenovulum sediminis]|uniref:UDP-N-acetylglucosamine 2-epimerase n=1 Tax=Catenovulum sediminis TaxID=1740262 RepID=UPI00117D7817|nr:UDP-N-acetylglucosamine 2-epimerase [Catenovulum sediminis]
MNKHIAVFTGNRAEFGLLKPVIEALNKRSTFKVSLIVSGAHVSHVFDASKNEIAQAGFNVACEIELAKITSCAASTPFAIGDGIQKFSHALEKLQPDFLIVYADRYEGFAAVIAASQMSIPVAHMEGGDLTEGGALDDSVRHAMTKLSHLHFTTNEEAKNRVLKLGEEAWRVFNVGFSAIDTINKKLFYSKTEIQNEFNLDANQPIIVFTQHSVTTEYQKSKEQIQSALTALQKVMAETNCKIFLTYPNDDIGCEAIIEKIEEFAKKSENTICLKSLGQKRYYGLLNLAKHDWKITCVGNSSSGIKETPAFNCPTVNIGTRQAGRLQASNVINTSYSPEDIYQAIKQCLFDKTFIKSCQKIKNPYGTGNAGENIADILANSFDKDQLLKKKMTY